MKPSRFLFGVLTGVFCVFGAMTTANATVTYSFSVKTPTTFDGSSNFTFTISARGTFYVDCGTDGSLSGTGVTQDGTGGTIDHTSNTTSYTYTCSYTSGGEKTIRFGQGTLTAYSATTNVNAILFTSPALVKSIHGNLSAVFPTLSGSGLANRPQFNHTFENCVNLESIPSGLFANITSSGPQMFASTFAGCTSLTTIPSGLFSGVGTGAQNMFYETFKDCTSLESIPSGLFSTITTGYSGEFLGVFQNCSSLTSIPSGLFSTIRSGGTSMFARAFSGCSSLESVPSLFGNLSLGSSTWVFDSLFSGCSNLKSLPYDLFTHVTSNGTKGLFNSLCAGCSSLESIPQNLFGTISSSGQQMFAATFANCTSLTTIPSGLFSRFRNGAQSMFQSTFNGCTSLESIPSGLFANITSGGTSMFAYTFKGCTSLESIPSGLFANITSGANNMFESTFQNCDGLTGYIPPDLFAGLIANNVSYSSYMMRNIFDNTGNLATTTTGCPANTNTARYQTIYDSYWSSHISCTPVITLYWFDGNTAINSSVCNYYDTFSLPTAPTKPGYAFDGWTVKTFDLSALDASVDGEAFVSVDPYNDQGGRNCQTHETYDDCSVAGIFNDMTGRTFEADMGNTLILRGHALCNDDGGTYGESGTPTETDDMDNGMNCWCQLTQANNAGSGFQSVTAPWIYNYWTDMPSNCSWECAASCANLLISDETFRTALYGQ